MSRRAAIYQPKTDTYLIRLTKGHGTIISAVDADLAALTWTALLTPYTVYACRQTPRGDGKQQMVKLHREILALMLGRDLLAGEEVDHINGNGLDNTRGNLRLATHAENMANSRKRLDNTSGFKGVHWVERKRKWCAQIRFGGKPKHLGLFTSKEAAYAAYCDAAEKYHGEFANNGGGK